MKRSNNISDAWLLLCPWKRSVYTPYNAPEKFRNRKSRLRYLSQKLRWTDREGTLHWILGEIDWGSQGSLGGVVICCSRGIREF